MRLRLLLLFCFVLSSLSTAVYGQESQRILSLKGHLDADASKKAIEELAVLPHRNKPLVLEVNSTSGDLESVFDLAKALYEWKLVNQQPIIVYIQDSALGPAALLPFLADELVSSVFVSWGDMLLSTDSGMPANVLRSRVRSLVSPENPNAALLRLMAEAMVDKDLEIVDSNGWRRRRAGEEGAFNVISPEGEALVVGQTQLRQLGLLASVESLTSFRGRYELSVEEKERLEEPSTDKEAFLGDLEQHIKFADAGPNRIGHILIDDRKQGITQATWIYVKSAIDYYKENRPVLIILELNTPGGEVFSAQKISDALKELDTQLDIPVVAYINNWAISAGAMLAYSCRYIAIVKDASMGAAEPVFAGQDGKMKTAPEKVNSALRTDFANRAGFFDRNTDIAEAMVDKDVILVRRHGKVTRLDREEDIRKDGPDPDEIISAKGKLLTLTADQMIELGVVDIRLTPKKLEPIQIEEREKGKWPASKALLFHHPFFDDIPEAFVDSYQPDWKVQFLALLASPAVASFLFLGMMLGFYVEINSPGFGFPGSLAIVCLSLILMSSFSLEIVNWLEVVFLIAGMALLAMEAFVIPGFGVAGIAGIVLFVTGLFAIMLPGIESVSYDVDSQTLNAAGEVFLERLAWLSGSLVLGTVAMFMMGRYVMPSIGALSRMVLEGEENSEEGFTSAPASSELPAIGSKGVADTPLRPAGRVSVDDELYDAMSSGTYIKAGQSVIVVRIEGNRVFVDPSE